MCSIIFVIFGLCLVVATDVLHPVAIATTTTTFRGESVLGFSIFELHARFRQQTLEKLFAGVIWNKFYLYLKCTSTQRQERKWHTLKKAP